MEIKKKITIWLPWQKQLIQEAKGNRWVVAKEQDVGMICKYLPQILIYYKEWNLCVCGGETCR